MAQATVVSLEEFREEHAGQERRQALHEVFDQWLDEVEGGLPEQPATLEQIAQVIWEKRPELTGRIAETLVEQGHGAVLQQAEMPCPECERRLAARPGRGRTVETLIGPVRLERPYFYCAHCRQSWVPLDEQLALSQRRAQWDVQQRACTLALETSFERAAELLEETTGVSYSDHMIHEVAQQVAAELTLMDVCPSREEIRARIAQVAEGKSWRPILVLTIDGAHVPTRPESAKGPRRGRKKQRAKRARWQGQYQEAKGLRLYLVAGDRIVQLISWHQVQSEAELGAALRQLQEAGLIPEDQVRLCVIADGAPWIWKHVQALFPTAVQILDYYHCSQRLWRVAAVLWSDDPAQQAHWVEATLARLYAGEVDPVLADLQAMTAPDEKAAEEIRLLIGYLSEQRGRVHYRSFRKGGYPLGSGAIESAHKSIGHVRLKRSGAWWYVENANHILALRCALYNGTLDQVFQRYQKRTLSSQRQAAA